MPTRQSNEDNLESKQKRIQSYIRWLLDAEHFDKTEQSGLTEFGLTRSTIAALRRAGPELYSAWTIAVAHRRASIQAELIEEARARLLELIRGPVEEATTKDSLTGGVRVTTHRKAPNARAVLAVLEALDTDTLKPTYNSDVLS